MTTHPLAASPSSWESVRDESIPSRLRHAGVLLVLDGGTMRLDIDISSKRRDADWRGAPLVAGRRGRQPDCPCCGTATVNLSARLIPSNLAEVDAKRAPQDARRARPHAATANHTL
jgi:hypothetical protein